METISESQQSKPPEVILRTSIFRPELVTGKQDIGAASQTSSTTTSIPILRLNVLPPDQSNLEFNKPITERKPPNNLEKSETGSNKDWSNPSVNFRIVNPVTVTNFTVEEQSDIERLKNKEWQREKQRILDEYNADQKSGSVKSKNTRVSGNSSRTKPKTLEEQDCDMSKMSSSAKILQDARHERWGRPSVEDLNKAKPGRNMRARPPQPKPSEDESAREKRKALFEQLREAQVAADTDDDPELIRTLGKMKEDESLIDKLLRDGSLIHNQQIPINEI